jgi:Arc/MetJ family transcription regulator
MIAGMRTTLSIDDDVRNATRSLAASTKKPFRTIVNQALRTGLKALAVPAPRKRYVTQPRPLTLHPGVQVDNV